MKKWSRWRPFPDPRKGEYLYAPFGPGVYQLRCRASGKLVLYGESKNVARRMSSLLPPPLGTGTRNNTPKRNYVVKHLASIDYRTKACANKAAASVEESKLRENKNTYIFPT